jgi:hypothetical protein
MSQRFSGSALYVNFAGQDLSAEVEALEVDEGLRLVDVTPAGAASTAYLPGQADPRIRFTLYRLKDGGDPGSLVYAGAQGTLTFGEGGTASGQPKWSAPVVIERAQHRLHFDDAVRVEVVCRLAGDWLDNYSRLGSTF